MRKSTRAAVVGGGVLALAGAGIAFAAWTTDGTGTADATATSAQNLVVTSTGTSGLYPTGSFTVPYTIKNPNGYDVKLSSITLEGVALKTAGIGTCSTFGISGSSFAVTDVVQKNNGNTVTGNFPISVSNLMDDGCQNAVFTLTLKAHGLSN